MGKIARRPWTQGSARNENAALSVGGNFGRQKRSERYGWIVYFMDFLALAFRSAFRPSPIFSASSLRPVA